MSTLATKSWPQNLGLDADAFLDEMFDFSLVAEKLHRPPGAVDLGAILDHQVLHLGAAAATGFMMVEKRRFELPTPTLRTFEEPQTRKDRERQNRIFTDCFAISKSSNISDLRVVL